MNRKVGRIEELVGQGYDVADIDSDDARITVRLERGVDRRIVTLDAADAHELLFGAAPTSARRAEVLLTR